MLVGSATVAAAPQGSPTQFDVPDLSLAANQTYGFYITTDGDSELSYSGGGTLGEIAASNSDLSIERGYDITGASAFSPRTWNGTIFYTVAPEPAAWAMLILGFGAAGAAVRRRRRAAFA